MWGPGRSTGVCKDGVSEEDGDDCRVGPCAAETTYVGIAVDDTDEPDVETTAGETTCPGATVMLDPRTGPEALEVLVEDCGD